MMMHVSERGKIAIMSHEAIVLTRYKDSAGIWTIGVGVTAMADAGINPDTYTGEISLFTAVEMFGQILPKYQRGVDRALAKYKLTANQHEYDCLVSECYNLGAGPINRFCQVWAKSGKRAAASKMMEYINAGGKPSKGLRIRRQGEVSLFLDGEYGSGRVSVYTASKTGKINWKSGRVVDAFELLGVVPPVALISNVPESVHEILDDQDKGIFESSTNIMAGAGGIAGAGGLLADIFGMLTDPKVQMFLIAVIGLAAFWIIWERTRKAREARSAKARL